MRPLHSFIAALILAVLVGCSSPEKKMMGEWHQEAKGDNIFANAAVQNGPKAILAFGNDHKFSLSLDVVRDDPSKRSRSSTTTLGTKLEGTWEIKDQQITFHTATADGRPIEDVKKEEDAKEAERKAHPVIPDPGPAPEPKPGDTIIASGPAKEAQAREELNKAMDKLDQLLVPRTPVPASAKVAENWGTLVIMMEDGNTMNFAKDLPTAGK